MHKIKTFPEGCGDTCTANKVRKIANLKKKKKKPLMTKLRSQSILVVYQVSHNGPVSKVMDCKKWVSRK